MEAMKMIDKVRSVILGEIDKRNHLKIYKCREMIPQMLDEKISQDEIISKMAREITDNLIKDKMFNLKSEIIVDSTGTYTEYTLSLNVSNEEKIIKKNFPHMVI